MAMSQQAKLFVFLNVGFALLAAGSSGRKIIVILGAPCAGCGTQSPNIVHALGIPHLDTGNMLRQAALSGTPAGQKAAAMMKAGVLVTDDIVDAIVEDRIKQPDCAKGFLLDGFPRNVAQSEVLDKMLAATGEAVTDVLLLDVPMEGLQQCVMHRWTADGGDEWTDDYLAFRVPKSLTAARAAGEKPQCQPNDLDHCNMWDDWTHEPLYRRADDNLQTLSERVKLYHSQTYPVLDHYKSQGVIRKVDGYQAEPKVWEDIQKELGVSPIIPDLQNEPSSLALATEPTEVLTAVGAAALVAAAATGIAVAVLTRPRNSDISEPLLVE